jgi:hypothetical protein
MRVPTTAIVSLAAGAAGVLIMRRRQMRWGVTDEEVDGLLPGDELVPDPDVVATRALTIDADPAAVWPWVAQLGQGRGGFFSYDVLENLAGCDVHSANRIVDAWQQVGIGDPFKLHPDVALEVAVVEPGRALVVRGGVPMGDTAPPYDFTWAFIVVACAGGTSRLVVRERYRYSRRWAALLVEPLQVVSFVMTQKMLRGIRNRAERAPTVEAMAASDPDRSGRFAHRSSPVAGQRGREAIDVVGPGVAPASRGSASVATGTG